jgi:S-disulfanyl-L-cysteine oxidoreductase SoxD
VKPCTTGGLVAAALRLTVAGLAAFGSFDSYAFQDQRSRSVWDGVYTAEQAKRGAALYAGNCESCHGLALTGGESAPPLTGGEFLSNWSGLTLGDLFERIRVSMPADRPGTLSREQDANIVAHILNVGQFPSGAAELSTRTENLKQIRIEAIKPEH